MNILKQIPIDNSDAGLIEKLKQLENDCWEEEWGNNLGYGRCYNARRRYRRLLNKLAGSKNATTYMITGSGCDSAGSANLIIGN